MRWWVVLILCASALVFSLAYGCSDLTVFSSLQDIRVCRRNWVIWQIIYDYQGLIAGLLAILAAWIGAVELRRQTLDQRKSQKLAALRLYRATVGMAHNDLLRSGSTPQEQVQNVHSAAVGLNCTDNNLVLLGLIIWRYIFEATKNNATPQYIHKAGVMASVMQELIDQTIDCIEADPNFTLSEKAFDGQPIVNALKNYQLDWKEIGEFHSFFRWPHELQASLKK